MKVLSHPGAKETGESHARLGALGTAGASTDFASNHQGANAALGQMVVRRNSWYRDKDEQLG